MTGPDQISGGIVLLSVAAIASGGHFLLRVSGGRVATNELQRTFFRAGHAHAGVLVILGLVVRLMLADPAVADWGRSLGTFVLYAAILMPAGFFLSVLGTDPAAPNRLRVLIIIGALSLVVGVIGAGVALIVAGMGTV